MKLIIYVRYVKAKTPKIIKIIIILIKFTSPDRKLQYKKYLCNFSQIATTKHFYYEHNIFLYIKWSTFANYFYIMAFGHLLGSAVVNPLLYSFSNKYRKFYPF